MENHNKVLHKLRCLQCQNYLSIPPIMLNKNGKSICGRCNIEENEKQNYTRNEAYEDIATLILFPCKNKKHGCHKKLTMINAEKHEISCKHKQFNCPTERFQKCPWTGKMDEIEIHFKEKHPELILKHPHVGKPDLKQDYEKYFLFKVYDFLFLIQLKCISDGMFWYCVRLMEDEKISNIFKFVLKLSNGNDDVIKRRDVQPHGNFVFNEEDCVKMNVDNIIADLGNYENIQLELR